MNHVLRLNYLSESICVNPLDQLELRLDLLPSPPHKENLIKADFDIPRVRSGRVSLAISFIIYLIALLMAFLCKASLIPSSPHKTNADL